MMDLVAHWEKNIKRCYKEIENLEERKKEGFDEKYCDAVIKKIEKRIKFFENNINLYRIS